MKTNGSRQCIPTDAELWRLSYDEMEGEKGPSENMEEERDSRVPRTNLIDEVCQRLQDRIISLALKPGDRLNFKQLGDAFGVSRAPLREAVQRLIARGLVTVKPQQGYFVTELNKQDVLDIYRMRLMLEIVAVERSIGRIPKQKLKALRDVFHRELVRAQQDEGYHLSADFHIADLSLHSDCIVGYANSKILSQTSSNILGYVEITQRMFAGNFTGPREHIAIIDALLDEDLNRARLCIKSHLKRVEKEVVEVVTVQPESQHRGRASTE